MKTTSEIIPEEYLIPEKYFSRYKLNLQFKVKNFFIPTKKIGNMKYKVIKDKIYIISLGDGK